MNVGKPYAIAELPGIGCLEYVLMMTEGTAYWSQATLYEVDGHVDAEGLAHINSVEPLADIMVKWDGCSNVAWRGAVNLHLCGGTSWRDFSRMMTLVFREMLCSIANRDEDLAELVDIDESDLPHFIEFTCEKWDELVFSGESTLIARAGQ